MCHVPMPPKGILVCWGGAPKSDMTLAHGELGDRRSTIIYSWWEFLQGQ